MGQKVWLYPANEKHGGSILESTVTKMEPPWYFYLDGKRWYWIGSKYHVYSTLEAAQEQQAKDKAEPQWRRRGRFHVLATPTLIAYLSFMTGIAKKNIEAQDGGRLVACRLGQSQRNAQGKVVRWNVLPFDRRNFGSAHRQDGGRKNGGRGEIIGHLALYFLN